MRNYTPLQCIEGTFIPNQGHSEQINPCTATLSVHSFKMFHRSLRGGGEGDLGASNQVLAQDERLRVISLYMYLLYCICKCNT